MIGLLAVLIFVAAGSVCIYAFRTFDQIVKKEYSECHAEWEKDGKPIGFFWVPRDGSVWSGSMARSGLALAWIFSSPDWASGSEFERLFWKLRVSVVVFWSLCAAMWFCVVYSSQ
jgi:hypothetical protein